MEPRRELKYDGAQSKGEIRDKSLGPRFLWPGQGDSRNLALDIQSRAETTKVATRRRDCLSSASCLLRCNTNVFPLADARDEEKWRQVANDLCAMKRLPDD